AEIELSLFREFRSVPRNGGGKGDPSRLDIEPGGHIGGVRQCAENAPRQNLGGRVVALLVERCFQHSQGTYRAKIAVDPGRGISRASLENLLKLFVRGQRRILP